MFPLVVDAPNTPYRCEVTADSSSRRDSRGPYTFCHAENPALVVCSSCDAKSAECKFAFEVPIFPGIVSLELDTIIKSEHKGCTANADVPLAGINFGHTHDTANKFLAKDCTV